jgi:hypothetical protein
MGSELEPLIPRPIDTVRVAGALRRSDRRVTVARIHADEITAVQTAKVQCVGDVTDTAIDVTCDLIEHARSRGTNGDSAKALACGELLQAAQAELRALVVQTGRRVR